MTHRRMFNLQIVDSDAFLDMPLSSQSLYFHLGMRADDDGFVGNPKKIMRIIAATDDDLRLLLAKRFILHFPSGIIVIKHWLMHNLIRADLYKETDYKTEKGLLGLNQNGAYTELREGISEIKKIESPDWLQRRRGETVRKRYANGETSALRIGKVRLGNINNILADKPQVSHRVERKTGERLLPEKQQPMHKVCYHLEDVLHTRIVNWGKQLRAMKMMTSAGYTEQQIIWTIDRMAKEEFYEDKGFDLMTVANNIDKYKAKARKALHDNQQT